MIFDLLSRWFLPGARFLAPESDANLSVWQAAIEAGHRAYNQGRYAEAEDAYRAALAEARSFGRGDSRLGTTLNDLGEACRARGKLDEAEPLFVQALALCEEAQGSDDLSAAQIFNNLAAVYAAQGRFREAAPIYRNAIDIEEYSLGRDHPVVATSLNNLALVYRVQGQYADALPLLTRALRIGVASTGQEHSHVGTSFNNLASVCFAMGRMAEAETFFKQALAIKQRTLGPFHPEVAVILENLGELTLRQGRNSEAERLFSRARAIGICGQAGGQGVESDPGYADLASEAAGGALSDIEIRDLSEELMAVSKAVLGEDEERPQPRFAMRGAFQQAREEAARAEAGEPPATPGASELETASTAVEPFEKALEPPLAGDGVPDSAAPTVAESAVPGNEAQSSVASQASVGEPEALEAAALEPPSPEPEAAEAEGATTDLEPAISHVDAALECPRVLEPAAEQPDLTAREPLSEPPAAAPSAPDSPIPFTPFPESVMSGPLVLEAVEPAPIQAEPAPTLVKESVPGALPLATLPIEPSFAEAEADTLGVDEVALTGLPPTPALAVEVPRDETSEVSLFEIQADEEVAQTSAEADSALEIPPAAEPSAASEPSTPDAGLRTSEPEEIAAPLPPIPEEPSVISGAAAAGQADNRPAERPAEPETAEEALQGIDDGGLEKALRSWLAAREAEVGEIHPGLLLKLNQLALVCSLEGRHAEAEQVYRRILVIKTRTFGAEHSSVVPTLERLAETSSEQGRHTEAALCWKRILALDEARFGPEHPAVAVDLNHLAEVVQAQGRLDEAERLHQRALGIWEEGGGPEHPEVGRTLERLALVERQLGDRGEAASLLRRALAIEEKALGEGHPALVPGLSTLAELYSETGKLAQTEALLRLVLEIRESTLGIQHPDLVPNLDRYASFLRKDGRHLEAERMEARARAIRSAGRKRVVAGDGENADRKEQDP
ncbi:MAG TPA: tetratricopeptide repeat protein [Terriglobia bacterium]